ncbi:MAG TPA: SDR family oxidoreductase [Thermoleophilia bacterium]|nr:SDR family oxidoreductase [Thermoleophilia bacterium]
MTKGIKGKVAVVTGGASGIGRATALAFARQGAKVVVVTARSMARAAQTVEQIRQLGGEAISLQCDVTSEPQVESMVASTVAEFGSLDIAFNNAGVGPDGVTIPFRPLTELAESHWDCVVDTNLKGVFLCMKHELRQMRRQGGGVIVNTSSTAGLHMIPTFGAYGPSKAGIVALTKLAALGNRDARIRVNVVCPGPTKSTGMSDRLLSCPPEEVPPGPPGADLADVMGEPDDVARVVLWLCSNEASHVNGNVLSVDGGLDIV